MLGLGDVRGSTRLALGLALAAGLAFAGCGSGTFEAGTPSGLGQTAPGGGTPGGGGGGGTPPPGGGGGGGTLDLAGTTNFVGLSTRASILFAANLRQQSVAECWIFVHDPQGLYTTQAAQQAITVDVFQPGTTTTATPPTGTSFETFSLGLSQGVMLVVVPEPAGNVDFFVDDGQGNTGTLKAKPLSRSFSTTPTIQLLLPADAFGGNTAGMNVGLTPTMQWTVAPTSDHLLVIWGTPRIFSAANGFSMTTDVPVVVRTSDTQFNVGTTGPGSPVVFAGGPLPAQNSASSTTWEWFVFGLDADGWAVDDTDIFFDMQTN